jgi:L-ascorbate metabolism protein UlaG (beta-lactamase superfamily)
VSDLYLTIAPVHVLTLAYAVGVLVGLFRIDAGWPARVALALLWPLGPLAFLVTVLTLLIASMVAFPLFGAILVALGLAIAAFAQPLVPASDAPAALRARFIGNMAYAITDGTITLFTDFPYESGYSVYMEYDPGEIRSATKESISLVTHRHRDHWDGDLFSRTDWRVVGPVDALAAIPSARVVRALPVNPTLATIAVGSITIEALPTPHANIGHYSYLVTWHGRRLYFTGDTDSADQLLAMKNLDVAFVSPWLFDAAATASRRIDAKRIVIYHQTTDERVPKCRGTCQVPAQGEVLNF